MEMINLSYLVGIFKLKYKEKREVKNRVFKSCRIILVVYQVFNCSFRKIREREQGRIIQEKYFLNGNLKLKILENFLKILKDIKLQI